MGAARWADHYGILFYEQQKDKRETFKFTRQPMMLQKKRKMHLN